MVEDVQYRTAWIDNSEQTIDIKSVYEEFRQDSAYRGKHIFHCPCCGEEMEAVLGEIRKRHFRHKTNPCGYNNYLHSTAEEVFFEEYQKCLDENTPFEIAVYPEKRCNPDCSLTNKEACPKRHKKKTIVDLTQFYKKIKPEERVFRDGRYKRPDLLLESESGEKLWIEIWVSHETDKGKREQGRILEIKIETESDIDRIRTHKLAQSNPSDKKVRFFSWDEVCENPELPRTSEKDVFDGVFIRYAEATKPTQTTTQAFPQRLPQNEVQPPIIPPSVDLTSLKELPVHSIPYWKRDKGPEWVNLGLPSGTLWSKEYMGSMTLEEAQREFPYMIPSLEQFTELISSCETTKPLPAGFIGPNGVLLEMYQGDFWTSVSVDENYAVAFHKEDIFDLVSHNKPTLLKGLDFAIALKSMRLCVRLVKKP